MNKKGLIKELKKKSYEIRNDTLDMCIKAGTGHITSSFSCAEILTALYCGNIMKYDPKNPDWEDRDRFILSKGQASPILYSTLANVGFFQKKWLDSFCTDESKFGVHLQCDVPGVEYTTGSLGHGLGLGIGEALAGKMNRKDYLTFVLLGDAELYEGSNWEAAMFASHNNLNNLVGIIDRNWLGVTDFTEDLCKLDPLNKKFESFGWDVKTINGHNYQEILDSFERIRSHKKNNPYMIIAETVKGNGIPFIENKPLWHGLAPKGKEAIKAKKELNSGRNYNG